MLFFLCYAFYSILFPYLFMTSKSIATQYQVGPSVFWWMVAGERIIYGLTVVGASYFGGKSPCKAKWIGTGFLMIAIGCFLLSLTAFIAPLPVVEKNETHLWKVSECFPGSRARGGRMEGQTGDWAWSSRIHASQPRALMLLTHHVLAQLALFACG